MEQSVPLLLLKFPTTTGLGICGTETNIPGGKKFFIIMQQHSYEDTNQ